MKQIWTKILNNLQKGEKSLKYFRGFELDATNESVENELASIQSIISEQADGSNRATVKDFREFVFNFESSFSDFYFLVTKPAIKVIIIGAMLQFLEQFSGLFGLLFFVSTIFKYSGSSLSPNASSIIVGIIQLVGCYCSTLLVDRAGRKILIGTSSFGISLGMFVFAAYSFMDKLGYDLSLFKWVPLASFSFTLFNANLGVLTLPFLVTSELIITLPKV